MSLYIQSYAAKAAEGLLPSVHTLAESLAWLP